MHTLGAILLPLLITRLGLPPLIKWQFQKKIINKNFEGKKIATAGGTILFLSLLLCYPFFINLPLQLTFPWGLFFFYLFGITLLGVVDDFWGEKECKGLQGHFGKLWRREGVSTGMYKAAGGLLLGIFIASRISAGNFGVWIMQGLYLALISNLFNLLDTRPARAAKMFIILSFLLMLFFRPFLWILLPIWGSLVIYLRWELDKNIMLGDTGAYMLGGVLGFCSLFSLSVRTIIFLNIFLLFLHLFCERFSLTKIIEEKLSFYSLLRRGRKN